MTGHGTYRRRLADDQLDTLLAQLSAIIIDGPRGSGKTTTARRRASSTVRLDLDAEAAAFRADPVAALRRQPEPVLLDEWQAVPQVLGAVRRAVEDDPRPNRFLLTGSVNARVDVGIWQGTGRVQRVTMYPMTVGERLGLPRGASFLDRLIAGERRLPSPEVVPALDGYVDLALAGGFPIAALHLEGPARIGWLESYLEDLLERDVATLTPARGRRTDSRRLRRYFEAWALNSAGDADHKTLYDAAGINRMTALAYDELLTRLFAVVEVPAWTSNRLSRLKASPKRYVIEPALLAAALRLDEAAVLRDGNLLGRLLDTFVAAQLRPQAELSPARPRMHHLRTRSDREEVDLVMELGGGRLLAFEIKATAAPGPRDARHLRWLREHIGDRFLAGVVLHTGPQAFELDDRILAAPIAALWG